MHEHTHVIYHDFYICINVVHVKYSNNKRKHYIIIYFLYLQKVYYWAFEIQDTCFISSYLPLYIGIIHTNSCRAMISIGICLRILIQIPFTLSIFKSFVNKNTSHRTLFNTFLFWFYYRFRFIFLIFFSTHIYFQITIR